MIDFFSLIIVVSKNESFIGQCDKIIKKIAPRAPLMGCSDENAVKMGQQGNPSLFLVDLNQPSEAILNLIQDISTLFPATKIVCSGHPDDATLVIRLVKMGVKDFLNGTPDEQELSSLLTDLAACPENFIAGAPEKGKIVAFYSPKGGSGVTLIAINLAIALSKLTKSKIVFCDPAPQCGDAATYLNLNPQYTFRDIIDNNQLLDHSFLEGIMVVHSSGVRILASPRDNQEPPSLDHLHAMKSVFTLLSESYGYVFVDAGHLEPGLLQFALSQSDLIFLVGNPDVVSLKGLAATFNKLKGLQYNTEIIKVLINRYNSKSKIDGKEFENMTKHPITLNLPNNYAVCIEAVNSGQPISSVYDKSDLAKKIDELASKIVKSAEPESSDARVANAQTKKGFLRCF